jgi:hypothetical protein
VQGLERLMTLELSGDVRFDSLGGQ